MKIIALLNKLLAYNGETFPPQLSAHRCPRCGCHICRSWEGEYNEQHWLDDEENKRLRKIVSD